MVSCLKYLGLHIFDNLTWNINTSSIVKKTHQHISVLVSFYRCAVENILTSCFTVWYSNFSAADELTLQQVVKTAQRINGSSLYCMMRDSIHPAKGFPFRKEATQHQGQN